MTEFRVGDRVVDKCGGSGVIALIEDDGAEFPWVGVEYDKALHGYRHNLDGHCRNGHGWWWRANQLHPERPLIDDSDWDYLLQEVT